MSAWGNPPSAWTAAMRISESWSVRNFRISGRADSSRIWPRILTAQNRRSLSWLSRAAVRGEIASLPISARARAASERPIQYSLESDSIRKGIEWVPKSFNVS